MKKQFKEMFQLNDVIKEIVNYSIIDNNFFYSNTDSELYKNSTFIISGIDSVSLYKVSDFLFTQNDLGEFIYYNNELLKRDFALVPNNINSKEIIAHSKPKRISRGVYEKQYFLLNQESFDLGRKITAPTIINFTSYCNRFLFGVNNNMLYAVSLINEKLSWSLNFSEIKKNNNEFGVKGLKKVKFLGVFEDLILITFNVNEIISIDIKSGKLINTWKEIPGININSQIEGMIPNTESFVLDKEQSKLIGAFHKYYLEIDLKSNEISYVDVSEELSEYDIIFIKQSNDIPFTKDHLYLTAMIEQYENDTKFTYDCLFLLNRNTLNIDWIYKFKEASLGTHKPKLSGNKLYQLDNNNTLHVFEKVIK